MLVSDFDGVALTHQKVTPGNTITSLSQYCYKYSLWRLNFDDGDSEIVVEDWVVGATSGAVGKVKYVSASSWTNGTGYLLIDSWNGTAWTNNEEIKVAAGATMANVDQASPIVVATNEEYRLADAERYRGLNARSALIVVYANTALVDWTGGKPDQTALIGTPMVANSSVKLQTYQSIVNFKCVDYTSQTSSIIQVKFSF